MAKHKIVFLVAIFWATTGFASEGSTKESGFLLVTRQILGDVATVRVHSDQIVLATVVFFKEMKFKASGNLTLRAFLLRNYCPGSDGWKHLDGAQDDD